MNRLKEKNVPIFVGPSISSSLVCFIPLLGLKLLGILNISWWWITCPLWIGWAICFILWLWFNSLAIVARTIFKPIIVPVVTDSKNDKLEEEKEEKENGL